MVHPVKKTFHRLNLLSIKSRGNAIEGSGDFTGAGGRIQTPFEVVSGIDLGRDYVTYRIFLASGKDDNGEFDRLKTVLGLSTGTPVSDNTRFNLSLGIASFSAWIERAQLHVDISAHTQNDFIRIHSAIPSDRVISLDFQKDTPEEGYNYLEEELMPADFVADGNRELSKLIRVLFSTQGKPFVAKVNAPFYMVPDIKGNLQNILFLE